MDFEAHDRGVIEDLERDVATKQATIDALVAALERIRREAKKNKPDPDTIYADASAALAKAKGKQA